MYIGHKYYIYYILLYIILLYIILLYIIYIFNKGGYTFIKIFDII